MAYRGHGPVGRTRRMIGRKVRDGQAVGVITYL